MLVFSYTKYNGGDTLNKVVIFFCDIYGTFDRYGKNEFEQKLNISDFVQNLNTLIEMNNADYLLFSFITDAIDKLKPFLTDSKIYFGKSFFANGYVDNNGNIKLSSGLDFKGKKIIDHISELKGQGDKEVVDIFYADDNLVHHNVLRKFQTRMIETNHQIKSIIPHSLLEESNELFTSKSDGLVGVNDCLNNYFEYMRQKKRR